MDKDMSISKKPFKILIMGLPGVGKTTLARELKFQLEQQQKSVAWFNADSVRQQFNDWDFSYAGRVRQADRMKILADMCDTDYVICDFVAPLNIMRNKFSPDYVIWLNTEVSSRYSDTDQMFETPHYANMVFTQKDAVKQVRQIIELLISK